MKIGKVGPSGLEQVQRIMERFEEKWKKLHPECKCELSKGYVCPICSEDESRIRAGLEPVLSWKE